MPSVLSPLVALVADDLTVQLDALWMQLDHALSRAGLLDFPRPAIEGQLTALAALLARLDACDRGPAESLADVRTRLRVLARIEREAMELIVAADQVLRSVRQQGYGRTYQFPPMGMFFGLGQALPLDALRRRAADLHAAQTKAFRGLRRGESLAPGALVITHQHGMATALGRHVGDALHTFIVLPVWLPFQSDRYTSIIVHEISHPVLDDLVRATAWGGLRTALSRHERAFARARTLLPRDRRPSPDADTALAVEALADAVAFALCGPSTALAWLAKSMQAFGEESPLAQVRSFPLLARLRLHRQMVADASEPDDAAWILPLLDAYADLVAEYAPPDVRAYCEAVATSCARLVSTRSFVSAVRRLRADLLRRRSTRIWPTGVDASWHAAVQGGQAREDQRKAEAREPFGLASSPSVEVGDELVEACWMSRALESDAFRQAPADERRADVLGLFHHVRFQPIRSVITTGHDRETRRMAGVDGHLERRFLLGSWKRLQTELESTPLVLCMESDQVDREAAKKGVLFRSLGWSPYVCFVPVRSFDDLISGLDLTVAPAGNRVTQLLFVEGSPWTAFGASRPARHLTVRAFVRFHGGPDLIDALVAFAHAGSTEGVDQFHAELVTGHDDLEITWQVRSVAGLATAHARVRALQNHVKVGTVPAGLRSRRRRGEAKPAIVAIDCRLGWDHQESAGG